MDYLYLRHEEPIDLDKVADELHANLMAAGFRKGADISEPVEKVQRIMFYENMEGSALLQCCNSYEAIVQSTPDGPLTMEDYDGVIIFSHVDLEVIDFIQQDLNCRSYRLGT